MRKFSLAAAIAAVFTAPLAGAVGLNLGSYQLAATYTLSDSRIGPNNNELSALTRNWDTGTLFAVEDEGGFIYEFGTDGHYISRMSLAGFDDTEALTYIGGGQFVLGEERVQDVQKFTYAAGGTLTRSAVVPLWKTTDPEVPNPNNPASLHSVGNVGLEGIAYDSVTGKFVYVKEKTPMRVREASIDFATGTASIIDLALPVRPGLLDLSDVATLSAVTSLIGTSAAGNLLLVSQESKVLLETTRSGEVLSFFDLTSLGSRIEGVTVDPEGNIYLVNEGITTVDGGGPNGVAPSLFRLSPSAVPLPAGVWLLISGFGVLGAMSRRRKVQSAGFATA